MSGPVSTWSLLVSGFLISTVLEQVNLTASAHQRLRTYSGGMIRRIGIAQALLNDPRLLVLDEPTAGLDPAERVRFREIINALDDERLVILSTHLINDVEVMATEIALLQQGISTGSGPQMHFCAMPRSASGA